MPSRAISYCEVTFSGVVKHDASDSRRGTLVPKSPATAATITIGGNPSVSSSSRPQA